MGVRGEGSGKRGLGTPLSTPTLNKVNDCSLKGQNDLYSIALVKSVCPRPA